MVEQVDVTCSRCNESCYGEVISTYGKYYHQYCFSCIVGGCNHDLSQVGFFFLGGELYCREDYRKLMGVKCAGCSRYVEGEAVSAAESRFHPSCFGCVRCGKVFQVGADICYDGEDFFCQTCNISPRTQTEAPQNTTKDDTDNARNEHIDAKLSSGKCAGCDNHIKTGQALLALDKQWHLWCFTCFKCGALLTGEYMGRDGIPYCEKDYQAEFGITCAGCGDYITGKVLQAGEKHYHPSCSRCAKCCEMFGEGEDMYLQGNEIWHPHCSDGHVPSDPEASDVSKSEEYESETAITTPKHYKDVAQGDFTRVAPASEVELIDANNAALSKNLNPVPYGKLPGFRSVKPPGFQPVKSPEPVSHPPPSQSQPPSKLSDDETDDVPPLVPPPPARSTSSQWRQKYTSMPRSNAGRSDQSNRPVSCAESSGRPSDYEKKSELKSTLSYSTNSLNSTSNGTLTKKGIGFNQLKYRINSQKDVRPIKLPTHIDPDRLRQFLNDPEHNVYLEDHEFYDLFKMTREKFYSLPQRKKQELKSGILFS